MGCFTSSQRTVRSHINSKRPPSQELSPTKHDVKIEAASFVGKRSGQLKNYYVLGAKLGSGAFGYVRLATHKLTQQKRAVKTIKKDSIVKDITERAKFFAEVDILRSTDHPNIVRLFEFYEDEKYYHLVTEHIPGGELFDYIVKSKMLSEPIAAHFMRQILRAVAYCHVNNIVHRDLKPENLLLDHEGPEATVKVIDFGTSTIKSADALSQRYGTAYYIAPEVLQKNYTEKCDLWSCGVILYILLSGKPPFYGREDREILRRVQKGEYSFKGKEWDRVSAAAKRLIARMLDYNAKTRISASEALQDDWFKRVVTEAPVPLESLANLQSFHSEQKIQHTVLAFIASQLLSQEECKRLGAMFRTLDVNGDGKLSKEELLKAYTQQIGSESAHLEVDKIMARVDLNDSGFIDYTEFLMASTQNEVLLSKKNLEAAFRTFDADGNGKISAREIKQVFCGGNETTEAVWQDLISEVDKNGDGEIDLGEFTMMMLKLFE